MTKVGLPGADVGRGPRIRRSPKVLKPLGYAKAVRQEPSRDRDNPAEQSRLDEFFGNLSLNAEEEPENGTIQERNSETLWAARRAPLVRRRQIGTRVRSEERMETVDDESWRRRSVYHRRKQGRHAVLYRFKSTRMHVNTRPQAESAGRTAARCIRTAWSSKTAKSISVEEDRRSQDCRQHDRRPPPTTAEVMTWPDGGNAFRGEKRPT